MYRTWTEHYRIDCIHKEVLANQGVQYCLVGDIANCEQCPHRKPADYECKCSASSIDTDYFHEGQWVGVEYC